MPLLPISFSSLFSLRLKRSTLSDPRVVSIVHRGGIHTDDTRTGLNLTRNLLELLHAFGPGLIAQKLSSGSLPVLELDDDALGKVLSDIPRSVRCRVSTENLSSLAFGCRAVGFLERRVCDLNCAVGRMTMSGCAVAGSQPDA